jgi:hypothetical protein
MKSVLIMDDDNTTLPRERAMKMGAVVCRQKPFVATQLNRRDREGPVARKTLGNPG